MEQVCLETVSGDSSLDFASLSSLNSWKWQIICNNRGQLRDGCLDTARFVVLFNQILS